MAKLIRKTQKVFGQDGATDQFAVFGTMKKVGEGQTPTYSKDIETIQSNAAYSQGWQDAIIANYAPFMEELNAICYSLTYQMSYLLQNGVPEWDDGTTYYINSIVVGSNSLLYRCLTDDCLNVDPTTDDGTNWYNYSLYGANQDLSNLTTAGIDKLHALKGYLDSGKLLSDPQLFEAVYGYNHSTFDVSKFTVVGTPTITDDGIASGFANSTNYIQPYSLNAMPSMLVIKAKVRTENILTAANRTAVCGKNSEDSNVRFYVRGDGSNASRLVIGYKKSDATYFNTFINVSANTEYDINITINGSNISISINGTEIVNGNNLYTANNIASIGVGSANGNNCWLGSIDLKAFSITINGIPVFSGTKTDIDTYTINNTTVTIPYTLSKTGSKIVDVAYRDRVIDVYNQYGSANYYTIDETNQNATLPMGEVYGFIEQKTDTNFSNVTQTAKNTSISWGMPDWSRAISKTVYTEYTATERGWINAEGKSADKKVGLTINSNIVAAAEATGTSDESCFACLVPVDVGDVYNTFKTGTNVQDEVTSIQFIPCKGEA